MKWFFEFLLFVLKFSWSNLFLDELISLIYSISFDILDETFYNYLMIFDDIW
jgi:hypothetical protein